MRSSIILLLSICTLRGQVLETKKGPVEIIGLEYSSVEKLQATLERLPDGELHYCAADIKNAGFPEASVIMHLGEHNSLYTVVTVVEPKRAGEVAHRVKPGGEIPAPESWGAMREAVRKGLDGGVYSYVRTLPFATKAPSGAPKSKPWWPALQERNSDADYEKALAILAGSKDVVDRMTAATVLVNFGDREGAWLALAQGLLDADDSVAGSCQQALGSLRLYAPRKVAWAPGTSSLAAVLHGTNLFGFSELAQTLSATGVDPDLAGPLLGHGGGRLVLAYLRAQHKDERDVAHGLLVQLRGADLGDRAEAWEAWLATL